MFLSLTESEIWNVKDENPKVINTTMNNRQKEEIFMIFMIIFLLLRNWFLRKLKSLFPRSQSIRQVKNCFETINPKVCYIF